VPGKSCPEAAKLDCSAAIKQDVGRTFTTCSHAQRIHFCSKGHNMTHYGNAMPTKDIGVTFILYKSSDNNAVTVRSSPLIGLGGGLMYSSFA